MSASLSACLFPAGAAAEVSVAGFYKSNPIPIVVGYAPGGGYDATARVLARPIGKFIPGAPSAVIRNMPGAGSAAAANSVYNTASKNSPGRSCAISTFQRVTVNRI